MKISVVLSTYNGEKYIMPLLESLKNQSLMPNEVLIRDDGSVDSTTTIITAFIKKNNLKGWTLIRNTKNLGWQENFMQGILQATGDVIFPCDQDDIWEKDKIEKMTRVINIYPECMLLCSDYKVLYMKDAIKFHMPIVSKLSNNEKIEKLSFAKSFLIVDRPGCTYCIRRELISTMEEMYFSGCPHDALAWRSAAIMDGLYIYHFPSICFRRHIANASDVKRRERESRIELAEYYLNLLNISFSFVQNNRETIKNSKQKIKYLGKCICLQEQRRIVLKDNSIIKAAKLFRWMKYYPMSRTYLADIFAVMGRERKS